MLKLETVSKKHPPVLVEKSVAQRGAVHDQSHDIQVVSERCPAHMRDS
jgi:hypothetical protein